MKATIVILAICLCAALAALAYFYRKATSLQKYLHKIEEGDKVKNRFLKNITQEIRVPLDGVVGFSDVCCSFDDLSEQERKDYLFYIHKNCDVLLRLLTGVLDVARYDSLCPDVQLEEFDLGDEVINTLTALESGIKNKPGVQLDYSEAGKTFMAYGDRTMVNKIMLNFVHNALKHTDSGSVTIHLDRKGTDFVKVSVEDTGCGIEPEKIREVFSHEYKVDSLAQGTGLGLFLCKTLAELQGGEIGVESVPGTGSTFWFTLPLAKQKDARS